MFPWTELFVAFCTGIVFAYAVTAATRGHWKIFLLDLGLILINVLLFVNRYYV